MTFAGLWISTVLLACIVMIWRWARWRETPNIWMVLQGLLFITASTALTQHAFTAAYTLRQSTINAQPDLSFPYLFIHYALIFWWLLGDRWPTPFNLSAVWPALFLYSSYLYFRTFYTFELGVAYPYIYLLAFGLLFFQPRRSRVSSLSDFPISLFVSLLLFLFLGLVSSIFSLSSSESLNQYTQIVCFALLPFLLARDLPDICSWRNAAFWCILLCSVPLIILGGVKFSLLTWELGLKPALHYRLLIADIGPNWISHALVTLLPLSIAFLLTASGRRRKTLWGVVLLGELLTIAYTQSNQGISGWIAVALGGGIFTLLLLEPNFMKLGQKRPRLRKMSVVAFIGLILILVWGGLSIAPHINSYSLYTRLYGWRVKLLQVLEHPWLGDGLNVRHTMANYGGRVQWENYITQFEGFFPYYELSSLAQKQQLTFHAHSLFLELAAGVGIPALLAFLWFLRELAKFGLCGFHHATGQERVLFAGCIAGIVASLGWGLIDVMDSSPLFFTTPTWILIGLLLAAPHLFKVQEEPDKSLIADFRPGVTYYSFRFTLYTLCLIFTVTAVFLPVLGNYHYRAAYTAYQEHRWATAAEELMQASRWEPLNAKYHQLRAETLINLGRFDDALTAYGRAVQLQRDFAPYHSQLGWLYWLQGDLKQATIHFQKAVEMDPREAWRDGLHADLALAFVAQGRITEAIELLKEAIELDPNMVLTPGLVWMPVEGVDGRLDIVLDPVYLLPNKGDKGISPQLKQRILAHLGKANYTPRLFTYDPNSVKTESSTSLDDVLDAIEADYGAAVTARSPEAPRLLATVAEAGRLAGMHSRAEKAYKSYQLSIPTSEYGFRELGSFYREQDRLEEAQAYVEHAVEINPTDTDSWLELANVYLDREMYDAAAKALNTAYHLSPLDARIYELQSQLYKQQGDLAQAAINRRRSLDIVESIPYRFALADQYRQLGQPEKATHQCLQIVDTLMRVWTSLLSPQLWQISECLAADAGVQVLDLKLPNSNSSFIIRQIILGHIFRIRGQLDQALVAYQAAAAARPDEGGPHYFLGETYQMLGKLQLAEDEYRLAAQLDPLESLPLLALGRMQWGLDKHVEALESFHLAIAATPGWGEAQMALGNALFTLGKRIEASTRYQLAQLVDGDIQEGVLYDFPAHLAEAKLQSPAINTTYGDYFTIDGERKRVLFMHPDTRLEYIVDLTGIKKPSDLELTFNLGMSPESWNKEGDGVTFSVYTVSNQDIQQVFSKYIDPKNSPTDRRWHPYRLDLSEYIGQVVKMIFETSAGPVGDYRFDWAGWGNLQMITPK